VGLIADIGSGPVALDTALFIYFIQEDPRFLPHILPLFEEADSGARELVTSAVTLLEVLVVPYRTGDAQLADRYEQLLTRSRGVRMLELSRDQLRAGAQLRAITRVKMPDALQLAAALGAGCKTFITNDRELPEISGLRIIQLSSYLDSY
jgi:predicted nucleic acid-binding protein